MITAILAATATSIASLVVLSIFKLLDMFEKEPWSELIKAFIFGLVSFFIGLAVYYSAAPLNSTIGPVSLQTFSASWAVSILSILLTQIGLSLIFFFLTRKEFDSLTDYILYFACFGVGFDWSERILTNLLNVYSYSNPTFTSVVFRSAFASGGISPFLMAAVGLTVFFCIHRRRFIPQVSNAATISGVSIFVLGNMAFYGGPFIRSITSPHILKPINLIAPLLQSLSQNVTLVLLTAAIASCVIFDMYLMFMFRDSLYLQVDSLDNSKESTDRLKTMLRELNRPLLQFASSSNRIWMMLSLDESVKTPRYLFNSYSKSALTKWLTQDEGFELEQSIIDELLQVSRDLQSGGM